MNTIVTLDEFIIRKQKDFPFASGELTNLLRDIGVAAKIVNREVNKAGLLNILGLADTSNTSGDDVQKLDVYATNASSRIRIESSADGYDQVLWLGQNNTQKGGIGYDDSSDVVSVSYGSMGNNHLNVDSSGNVGIGTASPGSTLSVVGTFSVVGSSDMDDIRVGSLSDVDITDGYLCVENLGGSNCSGTTDGVVYADDFIEHSTPLPEEEALPVILNMKNKEDGTLDHSSFPSYVSTTTEKGLAEGVSLSSQIKYLIKGMQEQQAEIEELKAEPKEAPIVGSIPPMEKPWYEQIWWVWVLLAISINGVILFNKK